MRSILIALTAVVTTSLCLILTTPPAAVANHYHTICVGHGLVHGSSTTDNAFHSRVEAGCGNPGRKTCYLFYIEGPPGPSETVPAHVNATCNIFSNYGFGEQASTAHVDFDGVFNSHSHSPH